MATEVSTVSLRVPAEAAYARAVRMMAANLAVVSEMSVDDVEDVRMAAGEGFVYACATSPSTCDINFSVGQDGVSMRFSLGSAVPQDSELADLDLVELMLQAVCDDFAISEDGAELLLAKRTGATNAE